MAIRKKHSNRLSWIFLKYLCILVVGIIGLIGSLASLLGIGMSKGIILPANYAEQQIMKNKLAISESEPFDPSLIPYTCHYGLFNSTDQYIEGNFSMATVKEVEALLSESKENRFRYIMIERKNETCVIQYDLRAHFASPILHRLFPRVELDLLILFFMGLMIIIIGTAILFAKKLKKELEPVLEATQKIKEQELEFEVKSSKIYEFNEVLESIQEMKSALVSSLKKEWEMEERRKQHISALAHDIKTPLTVIKGNAELLLEEEISEETKESVACIDRSSNQIEEYISLLIEAARQEVSVTKRAKVKIEELEQKIIEEGEILAKSYQVSLNSEIQVKEGGIEIDESTILRAVNNMIKNALEHSIKGQEVHLKFCKVKNNLEIQIEDFGEGFSEEALKDATQPFYTKHTARTAAQKHYGLGLYMAKSVAEEHNGELVYGNKKDRGAIVAIKLPIL